MKFLASHKIVHNKFEVSCLMIALSSNCEERINHEDFLKLILPREKKIPAVQDVVDIDSPSLPIDLEYALQRLIQRELEMH